MLHPRICTWILVACLSTMAGCQSPDIDFAAEQQALKSAYDAGFELGWKTAVERAFQEYAALRIQIYYLEEELYFAYEECDIEDHDFEHMMELFEGLEDE